jgi:hypothetical protein
MTRYRAKFRNGRIEVETHVIMVSRRRWAAMPESKSPRWCALDFGRGRVLAICPRLFVREGDEGGPLSALSPGPN